jgi:hypothetical protein
LIFPETNHVLFFQVIAESLSEEEIGGLKELFKMIDTDNSGTITYEELKDGLKRVGSDLMEPEIQALMDAVSAWNYVVESIIPHLAKYKVIGVQHVLDVKHH